MSYSYKVTCDRDFTKLNSRIILLENDYYEVSVIKPFNKNQTTTVNVTAKDKLNTPRIIYMDIDHIDISIPDSIDYKNVQDKTEIAVKSIDALKAAIGNYI